MPGALRGGRSTAGEGECRERAGKSNLLDLGRSIVPTSGYRLRAVRASDIETLLDHRHRMFSAIGGRTEEQIVGHDRRYRRWLLVRLRRGELVGQIAETRRGEAAASGCIWYRPDQPRPESSGRDVAPYILSMFTAPVHRGHGLASRIVWALIADAKRRGYRQVILHASPEGRSVYARLGFERRWEMRYWIDPADRVAWKRQRPARTGTRARTAVPR